MARRPFTASFTQRVPIPKAGIAAVMRSGRLHHYNLGPDAEGEVAALEREYAAWQGARYCLALASGGQAMQIALRVSGVGPGNAVLTIAFTLAPVPGAIAAVGGRTVLVEITEDLVIDLDDLAAKATSSGGRHLLLSNMRGHLCNMDQLTARPARKLALIRRPEAEPYVGSSIHFRIPGMDAEAARAFIARIASVVVEVKWFDGPAPVGFTSTHQGWGYITPHSLPRTDTVRATLFDMRLPLTFTLADCDFVAGHICNAVQAPQLESAA